MKSSQFAALLCCAAIAVTSSMLTMEAIGIAEHVLPLTDERKNYIAIFVAGLAVATTYIVWRIGQLDNRVEQHAIWRAIRVVRAIYDPKSDAEKIEREKVQWLRSMDAVMVDRGEL